MESKEALDAWLRHLQDAMACCEHCYQCENTKEKKKAFMERWNAGGEE